LSDIFQEVDEEVRREQLKKLWERYQVLVYVVAALILLGVGGWRAYEWWQAKQAAQAGAQFENAIVLSEQGKHAESEAIFARIASEGTPIYRSLARLRQAAEVTESDPKAAIAAYQKIAADNSDGQVLQDLAALRAGALLIDNSSYADVRNQLEPLTASGRTFRHTARELLALAAWRAGDTTSMKHWYEAMTSDPETPASTRSRVEMLMALAAPNSKS
jgi:hypothetical protein